MPDYSEFFEGFQQLISGFEEFINVGILPQSEGIGQFVGLFGAVVAILVIIFVFLKLIASGKIRLGGRI